MIKFNFWFSLLALNLKENPLQGVKLGSPDPEADGLPMDCHASLTLAENTS